LEIPRAVRAAIIIAAAASSSILEAITKSTAKTPRTPRTEREEAKKVVKPSAFGLVPSALLFSWRSWRLGGSIR
jgi:hypothetical protein